MGKTTNTLLRLGALVLLLLGFTFTSAQAQTNFNVDPTVANDGDCTDDPENWADAYNCAVNGDTLTFAAGTYEVLVASANLSTSLVWSVATPGDQVEIVGGDVTLSAAQTLDNGINLTFDGTVDGTVTGVNLDALAISANVVGTATETLTILGALGDTTAVTIGAVTIGPDIVADYVSATIDPGATLGTVTATNSVGFDTVVPGDPNDRTITGAEALTANTTVVGDWVIDGSLNLAGFALNVVGNGTLTVNGELIGGGGSLIASTTGNITFAAGSIVGTFQRIRFVGNTPVFFTGANPFGTLASDITLEFAGNNPIYVEDGLTFGPSGAFDATLLFSSSTGDARIEITDDGGAITIPNLVVNRSGRVLLRDADDAVTLRSTFDVTEVLDIQNGTVDVVSNYLNYMAASENEDAVLNIDGAVAGTTGQLQVIITGAEEFVATGDGVIDVLFAQAGSTTFTSLEGVERLPGEAIEDEYIEGVQYDWTSFGDVIIRGGSATFTSATDVEGSLTVATDSAATLYAYELETVGGLVTISDGGTLIVREGVTFEDEVNIQEGGAIELLGDEDGRTVVTFEETPTIAGVLYVDDFSGNDPANFMTAGWVEVVFEDGLIVEATGDIVMTDDEDGIDDVAWVVVAGGDIELNGVNLGDELTRIRITGNIDLLVNNATLAPQVAIDLAPGGQLDIEDEGDLDLSNAALIRTGGRLTGEGFTAATAPLLVAYQGNVSQTTGIEIMAGVGSVVIDMENAPAAQLILGEDVEVREAFFFLNGLVNLNTYDITLGNASDLAGEPDAFYFVRGDANFIDNELSTVQYAEPAEDVHVIYVNEDSITVDFEWPQDFRIAEVLLRPFEDIDDVHGTVYLAGNRQAVDANVYAGTLDLQDYTLDLTGDLTINGDINVPGNLIADHRAFDRAQIVGFELPVADAANEVRFVYSGQVEGTQNALLDFTGTNSATLIANVQLNTGANIRRTIVEVPSVRAAKTDATDVLTLQLDAEVDDTAPEQNIERGLLVIDGNLTVASGRLELGSALRSDLFELPDNFDDDADEILTNNVDLLPAYQVNGDVWVMADADRVTDNAELLLVGGDFTVEGDDEDGPMLVLTGAVVFNGDEDQMVNVRESNEAWFASLGVNNEGGDVELASNVWVGGGFNPGNEENDAPGQLALIDGNIETDYDTILHVVNTEAEEFIGNRIIDGAVIFGGANSFVMGPLRRDVSEGTATGGDVDIVGYRFPVGVEDTLASGVAAQFFRPFTLDLPSNLGNARTVTVDAADFAPSSTAGLPITVPAIVAGVETEVTLDNIAEMAWCVTFDRNPALNPNVRISAQGLTGINNIDRLRILAAPADTALTCPEIAEDAEWTMAGVYDLATGGGDDASFNENDFIDGLPTFVQEGVQTWSTTSRQFPVTFVFTIASQQFLDPIVVGEDPGPGQDVANVQLVHAAPAAGPVDVIVDGVTALRDFDYADATPFVPVRLDADGTQIQIVAGADTVFSGSVMLEDDGNYVVVATLDEDGNLVPIVIENARTEARNEDMVELVAANAIATVDTLDIINWDAQTVPFNNLRYGTHSTYVPFMPDIINFELVNDPANESLNIVRVELGALTGDAATLIAVEEEEGATLLVVTPDGVVLRPAIVTDTEQEGEIPGEFALHGNYPNPFNPTTSINFDLPQTADVTVEIVDMLGRRVMTLPVQTLEAGANRTLQVDAAVLASGTYLYRVIAKMADQTRVETGRMTLIK